MHTGIDTQRAAHGRLHHVLAHAFLAGSILFGVAAHLLMKFGVQQLAARPGAWQSYSWVFFGLLVYAVGTGCWVLCLGSLDLSYAYPFTGLSYVLVLAASWALFDDAVLPSRLAGVLFICAGVTLIPRRVRGRS
jgi:multidrug transporter EmrE-like cation transporter